MKRLIWLIPCAVMLALAVSGCENVLDNNDRDGTYALSAIRSVVNDPVPNCQIETVHEHDGVLYSGHYNNDGHVHHNGELQADHACPFTSCAQTGVHDHNGTDYAGHHGEDGCGRGHHGGGHHGNRPYGNGPRV